MKSRIDKSIYKYTEFIDVKFFTKNGKYHREKDLPAIVNINDHYARWYINGEFVKSNLEEIDENI